jgi:hypothetical protein
LAFVARYLIVAHQTAESPELVARLQELNRQDGQAEFVLLVPATPVDHLLLWEEGETRAVAQRRADSARQRLESLGLRVIAARVGDGNPVDAIQDEVREHPDYAAVVVSTFPAGVSRWLRLDLPSRVARVGFGPRIVHVVAQASPSAKEAAPSATPRSG